MTLKSFLILIIVSFNIAYADEIKIAAASRTGRYYLEAAKICDQLTRKTKYVCSIIETAGSIENLELITNKKVDIAIVQANVFQPVQHATIYKEILYIEPLVILGAKDMKLALIDGFDKPLMVNKKSGAYSVLKDFGINFLPIDSDDDALCKDTRLAYKAVVTDYSRDLHIKISSCNLYPYNFSDKDYKALTSILSRTAYHKVIVDKKYYGQEFNTIGVAVSIVMSNNLKNNLIKLGIELGYN
jgi:TRAP-type uncharacterized transport system substrate-binding protein